MVELLSDANGDPEVTLVSATAVVSRSVDDAGVIGDMVGDEFCEEEDDTATVFFEVPSLICAGVDVSAWVWPLL